MDSITNVKDHFGRISGCFFFLLFYNRTWCGHWDKIKPNENNTKNTHYICLDHRGNILVVRLFLLFMCKVLSINLQKWKRELVSGSYLTNLDMLGLLFGTGPISVAFWIIACLMVKYEVCCYTNSCLNSNSQITGCFSFDYSNSSDQAYK